MYINPFSNPFRQALRPYLNRLRSFIDPRCLSAPKMRFPTFQRPTAEKTFEQRDYFRFATIGLALQRIENEGIPGNLAEAGVYKGNMSQFLNQASPNRKLYLFDSFEGFPEKDLETNSKSDNRFRDTSVSQVLHRIGDSRNIIVRKGFVPETFAGLEDEIFSFVLLDLDLFGPTVASLDFFYPRMSSGGYIMIHDYNNPESNWACKRAVESFMLKREERIFEIPDEYGTALFRKI